MRWRREGGAPPAGEGASRHLLLRLAVSRDKRACDALERRWSPPPMNTSNPKEVTSTLPDSWIRMGCPMDRERTDGESVLMEGA
ncbi:hypothetical protein EVAR_5157_1 [Eumeta japonica]|uniref:Uncharacterized protein n=1 Tax=Eumeta variegata TaxID=151549 RepID=A0A4C1SXY2_EUMVA|nr:hypothetical protein EVAR_5157_1 [Eumeta japonica]